MDDIPDDNNDDDDGGGGLMVRFTCRQCDAYALNQSY